MKILLIYPYCLDDRINDEDITFPPMGLYYIGALLKEHAYNVEILNFYNLGKSKSQIKEILIQKNPDIIGFSILNANRWGGLEVAGIAKKLNPDVKIIFGGISATFLWKHFLKHFNEIDYIVIGEGEYTFLNLVNLIENKDFENIANIKGIAYRQNDLIVQTKPADLIKDIDLLPNPAKYFNYHHVSLSRGCPGNCTFCGSPMFWGAGKVRFHSSEYFVEQLEFLYNRGISFFFFSDDTFTMKKKAVIRICQLIIEKNLNITWNAISRVSHIDQEILLWMRMAGCAQISYGVESGSEKIRDKLNKNIKSDQIQKAFYLTQKYGIMARAYFIYGSPGETVKTIKQSINLILKIKPLSAIFYVLTLFPGIELYNDFKKATGITDDIWLKKMEDILYFEHDDKLTKDMILEFGKQLRKAFYSNLHTFARSIDLINKKELYPFHADFCSRLAMTFTHGDYSQIDMIKNKEKIAEKLYEKALSFYPDHRAYLGLGILNQKKGNYDESIRVLQDGLKYYPDSNHLNMCLKVSYDAIK